MQTQNLQAALVQATVLEVLPKLGLAYVADSAERIWGVTRGTPGTGIDTLRVGEKVQVQLHSFDQYTLVQSYFKFG